MLHRGAFFFKKKTATPLGEGRCRLLSESIFISLLSLGSLFGHGSLGDGSGLGFLGAATAGALGSLLGGVLEHVLVVVDELDDGHLGVVTVTDAGLQDAGVTTGALGDLLRHFAEELVDGLFAVEVAEDDTAVVGGVLFGAADERLDIHAEGLGFGNSGLDTLVHNQRSGHVGKHSDAMGVGSGQMIYFATVSHILFLFFIEFIL